MRLVSFFSGSISKATRVLIAGSHLDLVQHCVRIRDGLCRIGKDWRVGSICCVAGKVEEEHRNDRSIAEMRHAFELEKDRLDLNSDIKGKPNSCVAYLGKGGVAARIRTSLVKKS
jgi:hypothetical protein